MFSYLGKRRGMTGESENAIRLSLIVKAIL